MSGIAQQGRRGRLIAAVAALLVVAGVIALGIGLRAQRHAPQPPASAAMPYASAATSRPSSRAEQSQAPAPANRAATKGPLLNRSVPVRLDIPAIGVTSGLQQLGLNPDHTLEVPPLGKDSHAGWYRYSPTPGQLGPSVILGHVDSAQYGPGVFFELGALRPGNTLTVTRSDHIAAVFRVDRVVSYPKEHFPTLEVYGNTDHAALRLITCGGKFDLSSHNYENNIVAYASLISSHRV
jgi:sortase (surface protein transpeptidase)